MFNAGCQSFKKAMGNGREAHRKFQKVTDEFKQVINNNFTPKQIERAREFFGGSGGAFALYKINEFYKKNEEYFTQENIQEKVGNILECTLPAGYATKSALDARADVNHAFDNLVRSQDMINKGRSTAALASPAFSLIPLFATPAFAITSVLSAGDISTISQVLRIKKMIEIRPDIFSEHEKKQSDDMMRKIEKHFQNALLFDALKITYRGLLVRVNRDLRKKMQDQQKPSKKTRSKKTNPKKTDEADVKSQYQINLLQKLADNGCIFQKSNLPLISLVLPTSLFISQLSAHDTRELTHDIKELDAFFKKIIFKGEEGEGEDSLDHQTQQEAIIVKTEPNQEAKKETKETA